MRERETEMWKEEEVARERKREREGVKVQFTPKLHHTSHLLIGNIYKGPLDSHSC
jgi:hypothetical protein